jgi:hypothetical protein
VVHDDPEKQQKQAALKMNYAKFKANKAAGTVSETTRSI